MNRQFKRQMQRDERAKRKAPARPPQPAASPTKRERTKPRQFVREVAAEMRKVAWPTPKEVFAYSVVVVVAVIFIGAVIFGMDFAFTKGVLALFGVNT